MKKHLVTAALSGGALALSAAVASAAPTLDGSIAGDNYTLAAVQTTQTQFGNNTATTLGSELDAAYTRVEGGVLYLTLTGNLENNFNKLNIFIDSVAGGQNTIGPDTNNGGVNPINDGWAINYSGVGEGNSNGPGFTFDTGFAADYLLINRRSDGQFDFDFSSVGSDSTVEGSGDIFGGSGVGSNSSVGASGLGVAFDNSNVDGVAGGTEAADPVAAAAVQTGLELAIPLSAIGNPGLGDVVLISAHINGSNHDFLSNQSLGGFAPPQSNLGGDGGGNFTGDLAGIDLNQFAGAQYFSVTIPEPTSLAVLGLGGLTLLRRRR